MKVSNKSRGKYFEDTISEKLRKYLGYNKTEIYRNQNSGNYSTEFGDVHLPFDCIIECKFNKSYKLDHFYNNNSQINNWLIQLENEREKFSSVYNRDPILVLMISQPYSNIYSFVENKIQNINYYSIYDKWFIYRFEDILDFLKEKFYVQR